MKILKFSLCLVLLISIAGCKNKSASKTENVFFTITDDYGREVVLENEPQKIISVSPGITEIIYALESGNKLIGRSDYCLYPPEVVAITSVGGISDINVEKIIGMNPDLVLIGSMVPKQAVDFLTEAKINTIAVKEKNSFNGVYENILTLGSILNQEAFAGKIADSLRLVLDEITHRNINNEKPKVYYVVGFGKSGDYTAGGNTYIQDIITLAGGKNIAEDLHGWSFSRELLFERDPEYIFIREEDYQDFMKSKPYDELTAVKKKNVYPIESALMDVQGPRSIQAVRFISETIHPKK